MVIVDTNILIDHLRRSEKEESEFRHITRENPRETFAVSMITVQELYGGKSMKDRNEALRVLAIFNECIILPYTFEVASLAGEIERDLSVSIEFPDAAIAATAIFHEAKLFMLNKKDFAKIPKLELYG